MRTLSNLFSNPATQQFSNFLPDFLGTRNSGQALFWSGVFILIGNILIIVALILGAVYLYYYSEVKATKNARKGALASLCGALFFSLLICLIGMFVWIFTQPQQASPFMNLFTTRSGTLPAASYIMTLVNMFAMAITLCFSKFWRMRRAEKVRKEKKQAEEEEDFMRMMGIDPNGPLYSESESETEDDDESDEEEEQQPLNQQVFASPKTQIITLPPNQPQAHVVQRYVVPGGGQQMQVQQQSAPRVVGNRIYL